MRKVLLSFLLLSILCSLSACFLDPTPATTAPPKEIIWNVLDLSSLLPTPASSLGYIHHDYDDWLCVEICNTTHSEYKEYLSACIDMGYIIDAEKYESHYIAYNEDGFKLILHHSALSNSYSISLSAPEQLGEIQWPTTGIGCKLPATSSSIGKIEKDTSKTFTILIGNTTLDEYRAYVSTCEAAGFTVDYTKEEKKYSAYDNEGYQISITYEGCYRIRVSITLSNDIAVPSSAENYRSVHYETVVKELQNAGFTNIRTEAIYDLIIGFFTSDGDVESVSIAGNSSFSQGQQFEQTAEVIITYHTWADDVPSTTPTSPNPPSNQTDSTNHKKVTAPKSNVECEVLYYSEVVELFKNAGFTNITTIEVGIKDNEDFEAGSIVVVSVNGNELFDSGEEFWSDTPVIIYYRVPVVTVTINYYTTNDSETAKLGNSGVYAYVMKHKTYNVYWIIDFDEGYAYTFTDQAGDDYCSKIEIKSGTLNDRVTITYRADGMSWSQGLHFKYKNQPTILIMQDEDGFKHEYETTSLLDAWEIMYTKTMVDY